MDEVFGEDNGSIIYRWSMMEAFIPDDFFTSGLAEETEDGYMIFGNFITYHYANENINRQNAKIASFEFPMMFNTIPDNIVEEKVDIGYGEQKYKILQYYKGGIVFKRREIIQNVSNVEKFTTLLFEGKCDNVDYDRLPTLFNVCKKYNGAKLQVPAMYEHVIISSSYRNPNDISVPARFVAKSKGFKVKGMTLREKAAFTSTFSAITFEDKISMLTIAHNAKMSGRKEVISDVERVSLGDL